MPPRREYPYQDVPEGIVYVGHGDTRPDNPWEALVQAQPHHEVAVSRAELLPLRDVISDAIDTLDEQQRWIFDSLFVRRLSLRQLGREIGMPKSTVARWRDRLLDELRQKLEHEPLIERYLYR
jgi:RNA polymerase sigma factor (sigma-70 family)